MPKKTEGGPFGIFQHPFCRKTAKKLKGDPLGEKNFRKRSLAVPKKNWKGDPLVSPGMVCYAGKQEKPFWFSSLDQIVQFVAIIFCRTFVELFWSVRVDWKKKEKKSHYSSRVSLHEAPTKKNGETEKNRSATVLLVLHANWFANCLIAFQSLSVTMRKLLTI